MTDRRCFLTHFALCLGLVAAAFLAAVAGLPEMIWAADASRVTGLIALLTVGASARIGWQAWGVDAQTSASFGHLSVRMAPMLGILGTTIGLSLQAQALAGGAASLGALATSLYTTGCGMAAALILEAMTHNLDAGIERARAS